MKNHYLPHLRSTINKSNINADDNIISKPMMSWMDSWSRPSKQAKFPPPLYLTEGGDQIPYCHTCGRVISTRGGKPPAAHTSPVKYCSERCRRSKPSSRDRQIEDAFVALLNGDQGEYERKYTTEENDAGPMKTSSKVKAAKGDPRLIIWCSDAETLVFGSRFDPEKMAGRKKNRPPRGVPDVGEWKSVDMEDKPIEMNHSDEEEESEASDDLNELQGVKLSFDHPEVDRDHICFGAGKRRPSQSKAEVNGSVGGERGWAEKIEETDEMLQKRREGQKRAEEKEMVRRAARRGVAFGFSVPQMGPGASGSQNSKRKQGKKGDRKKEKKDEELEEGFSMPNETRRKCEAVITKAAVVVEASFAKGDWGIRWREEV